MASITLDIPDEVLNKLSLAGQDPAQTLRLAAAFSLCSRGELATGLGARLAGLTYADFMEVAARAKVELFPIDIEELKREIAQPLPEEVQLEAIKRELGHARGS
jgi:hypothetical protein